MELYIKLDFYGTKDNHYISKLKKEKSYTLKKIPNKHKTYYVCKAAIKKNALNIEYLPKHIKENYIYHKELCNYAFKKNIESIEYIPHNFINKKMVSKCVKKGSELIQFIPLRYLTYNFFIKMYYYDNNNEQLLSFLLTVIYNKKHNKFYKINDIYNTMKTFINLNNSCDTLPYLPYDIIKNIFKYYLEII